MDSDSNMKMTKSQSIGEGAFERFCIMSEQEDVGDLKAIRYIRDKYGRKIAEEIWSQYCKQKS